MPGKVKVRIVEARDLPVMDRSSELADAFAEASLQLYVKYLTHICYVILFRGFFQLLGLICVHGLPPQKNFLQIISKQPDQIPFSNFTFQNLPY